MPAGLRHPREIVGARRVIRYGQKAYPVAPEGVLLIPPPPLPPIHGVMLPGDQKPADIVSFTPGPISCASGVVSPDRPEKPFATSTKRFGSDEVTTTPTYTLTFAIDENGRAVDIQSSTQPYPGFYVDTTDLAPSLAASRFASGAARQRCAVTYAVHLEPVPAAPRSLLYEVASAPVPGPAESEIYARLNSDGECSRGPGSPRRLDYPDFQAISQRAGTRSWSFLGFDVDDAGKTRNVRVLGSSGNSALDAASVKALGENRYASGKASHGCTFHFYRLSGATVPAPDMPADAPHENGELGACTVDPKSIPMLLDGNAYPTPFSARRIEGYAIIGFDTAPWGAVGNVRTLASEPDSSFGLAATQAIYNSKVSESDVGHRGCVRRILFKLPMERSTAK